MAEHFQMTVREKTEFWDPDAAMKKDTDPYGDPGGLIGQLLVTELHKNDILVEQD